MAAKELEQRPQPEKEKFEREWPSKVEQYPMAEGEHITIVGLKTTIRPNAAQQAALIALLEGIAQIDVAKILVVGTIPAAPPNTTINVTIDTRLKPLPNP